jgi:hypothetical protein
MVRLGDDETLGVGGGVIVSDKDSLEVRLFVADALLLSEREAVSDGVFESVCVCDPEDVPVSVSDPLKLKETVCVEEGETLSDKVPRVRDLVLL